MSKDVLWIIKDRWKNCSHKLRVHLQERQCHYLENLSASNTSERHTNLRTEGTKTSQDFKPEAHFAVTSLSRGESGAEEAESICCVFTPELRYAFYLHLALWSACTLSILHSCGWRFYLLSPFPSLWLAWEASFRLGSKGVVKELENIQENWWTFLCVCDM